MKQESASGASQEQSGAECLREQDRSPTFFLANIHPPRGEETINLCITKDGTEQKSDS